jgi:hypothetical protein
MPLGKQNDGSSSSASQYHCCLHDQSPLLHLLYFISTNLPDDTTHFQGQIQSAPQKSCTASPIADKRISWPPKQKQKRPKIAALITKDKDNRGNAAVGVGVMCLATLIIYAFLRIPNTEELILPKSFLIFIMVIFWVTGLTRWIDNLGEVSVALRNKSVIGGLFGANAGLVYTLLWNYFAVELPWLAVGVSSLCLLAVLLGDRS